MKRFKTAPIIFILAYFVSITLSAQDGGLAAAKLQQEFPKLTARYGNQLSDQKAHYIFAVDISSSMQPYQGVVLQNLQKFVDALPNGDQITIIRMADENYTDYVNLFKCITLDSNVRQALSNYINSGGFNFLSNGDSRNGSDGFKTARLIVDAINTIGSNELTFIYLLTDFEYWTHANHYDKGKVDWKSLENKVPDSYKNGMCKFGIELDGGVPLQQGAIFKKEMDNIFGPINYQPVSSASVLSQWFGHIIADVMASKLNASLKKEWNEFVNSIQVTSSFENDLIVSQATIDGNVKEPLLIDSLTFSLISEGTMLRPSEANTIPLGEGTCVGQVYVDKGFLPGYVIIGDDGTKLSITLHSAYKDEIDRLQKNCKEDPNDTGVGKWNLTYPLNAQSSNAWGSFIPLWAWILIGVVLFIILLSFIVQFLFMKTTHEWMVRVMENGKLVPCPQPEFKANFSIGNQGDFPVNGAIWRLTLEAHRYNPLLFWKKSGYYINCSSGSFTIKDDSNTPIEGVSAGIEAYLCPLKGGQLFVLDNASCRIDLQN